MDSPKGYMGYLLVHKKSTYTPDEMVELYILKTCEYKGQWNMKDQTILSNQRRSRLV